MVSYPDGSENRFALRKCGWLTRAAVTVRQAWDFRPNGHLMFGVVTKIKKCKKMLKSWSKNYFGNVKNQIRTKIELLWRAEETLANGGNYDMVVQLRRQLNV